MFRRTVTLASATAAIALGMAMPQAQASIFSSSELSYDNALLSQFNLVTLNAANSTQTATTTGTANLSSTIGGRAIIGGNATFADQTSVCTVNCSGNSGAIDQTGASFGALTVFGKLVTPTGANSAGSLAFTGIGAGDVNVKGTTSGNIVLNRSSSSTNTTTGSLRTVGTVASGTNVINATAVKTTQSTFGGTTYNYNYSTSSYSAGAKPQVNQALAAVFPFSSAYASQAKTLATGIANLPGSYGVKAQTLTVGNSVFFTANNDYSYAGKNYGVVTTTVADLAAQTNFSGIDNNGNDATLVIVRGDGANYTLPSLSSYANSNRVIFDFVDATTLKFGGAWAGSILAPLATITMGGAFDGSVIVNNITQTQALYSSNLFIGDLTGLIPEPASLVLLGAGAVAAGLIRRRRK